VARLTLQGLLAEARQLAAELETLPDSAEALNLAGSIYEYVHETQKAVDCWERTLKIRPDSPEVHFNLGFVARQAGEFEKAESHFLKSYAISPDLGDLRYYLADSQLNLGEADDAIATLEGAKDLNRFGAKGRCVLGRAYAQRGDFRKARENFEAALVMNPELVEAHFGLSKALTRLGEPEKAKKHGDAAAALQRTEQRGLEAYRPGEVAEIASDAGSVRRRLAVFCRSGAEVYFRLGRNAQAEPLLRRAAALSVESPESSRSNEKGPPPAPAL
jgi:tetratricopeptide (TPR) repeat protein